MGRKHVEFIHIDDLEWETLEHMNFSKPIQQKILSVNLDTGAFTSLVQLSPDTKGIKSAYTNDLEVLVLAGDLILGNHNLQDLSYLYLEAGVPLDSFVTKKECRMLVMSEGTLTKADSVRAGESATIIDTYQMPWEGTITEGFPIGAMRKSLYDDPVTGKSSWLLGVLPQFKDERFEIHPVVEEAYQISGEMQTNKGLFSEGSYFWRPAEIPHGQFDTKRGCLTFFRTDGFLKTTYVLAEDLV